MNAKLQVVQGRPQGKTLLFPPGEYLFGRGSECHIRPKCDWVSRQHCLFRVLADGRISVRDLGSRNGTLVNGMRVVAELPLKVGDQLQVGPLVFVVCLDEGSGLRRSPKPTTHEETFTTSMEATSDQLQGASDVGAKQVSALQSTEAEIDLPATKAS